MGGMSAIALALALTGTAAALAQEQPRQPAMSASDPALFDARGFRTARYRAPVKADPAPAARIGLAAALTLAPGRDALFIDVTPVEVGVRDPGTGVWTLASEHLTIPGALWLPETGRAPVDAVLWQALAETVRAARVTAPGQPVILFCRADCWMSWNAARRLAQAGAGNVHWLAEGTDGWHAAGRPLVVAVPVATPAS
jgi:PQQ-dependent catabolism-associated CXXCW motif protein